MIISPDLANGLLITLTVSVATVLMCPLLCWTLATRSKAISLKGKFSLPDNPASKEAGQPTIELAPSENFALAEVN